ncbi:MAG: four helix bundle protein [Bacteroidota bacterium]|nr:four helix bundle protein [Bacteroidota bacterium]
MDNEKSKFKNEFRKRVYRFALDIIKFVDNLPKDKSCNVIGNQLLRSATSIGANIIEAGAASSKKDFTNFFNHALKSANETKFWIGLLRDSEKSISAASNNLLNEVNEIANILGSSLLTLRGKK